MLNLMNAAYIVNDNWLENAKVSSYENQAGRKNLMYFGCIFYEVYIKITH